jgi:hypothetical protein
MAISAAVPAAGLKPTRFTLVVRPDGRAILVSPERLSDSAKADLIAQLRGWEAGHWPIVVLDGCDVVQIASIELDLDKPAEPVAV